MPSYDYAAIHKIGNRKGATYQLAEVSAVVVHMYTQQYRSALASQFSHPHSSMVMKKD